MRDNRIRTMGLESDTYPTATFKLTAPIAVPAAALTGAPVDVTLRGDLTIHGATKTVDIPAKAQLDGSTIQIAGALTFPFSDFGMTPPSFGSFVSVEQRRDPRVPRRPGQGFDRASPQVTAAGRRLGLGGGSRTGLAYTCRPCLAS